MLFTCGNDLYSQFRGDHLVSIYAVYPCCLHIDIIQCPIELGRIMSKRLMIKNFCAKTLGYFNRAICTTAIYYTYAIYYTMKRLDASLYIHFFILSENNSCNVCHCLLIFTTAYFD